MTELNTYWHKPHDGFQVTSKSIPNEVPKREFNHKEWHDYLMGNSHNSKEKNLTVNFLVDHLVKFEGLLYFVHCFLFKRDTCNHCASLSPPSQLLHFLLERFNGYLPFPVNFTDGHFQSFLQMGEDTDLDLNPRTLLK